MNKKKWLKIKVRLDPIRKDFGLSDREVNPDYWDINVNIVERYSFLIALLINVYTAIEKD
jgi:hypothetical protein